MLGPPANTILLFIFISDITPDQIGYICLLFTKLISLSNKSTKSEDFYLRFEEQLKESQSWPGSYLYKFILKNDGGELDKLKSILDNFKGNISQKSSTNNKFISVTFDFYASTPADVIKIYKEVSVIEDIISL